MHQQKEKTEKKVVTVSREEDLECQGLLVPSAATQESSP